MIAPLSLVITVFAHIEDVCVTVTSQLQPCSDNALLLIDLGTRDCSGVDLSPVGVDAADMRDTGQHAGFFHAIQAWWRNVNCWLTTASFDDGLIVTLQRIAFSGHWRHPGHRD